MLGSKIVTSLFSKLTLYKNGRVEKAAAYLEKARAQLQQVKMELGRGSVPLPGSQEALSFRGTFDFGKLLDKRKMIPSPLRQEIVCTDFIPY
jgi:hypothetical protein